MKTITYNPETHVLVPIEPTRAEPFINPFYLGSVAEAIESLFAENERLKAELAKYRDAYVVAYLYKYRNCFGDEVWTTDHNWGNRIPFESKPLIVKPDENK